MTAEQNEHVIARLQRLRIALAAALPLTLIACSEASPFHPQDEQGSEVLQLTDQLIACDKYDAAALEAAMGQLPDGLFTNFSGDTMAHAQQAVAGLPPKYLAILAEAQQKAGLHIDLANLGGYVGMTYPSNSGLPFLIQIAPSAYSVDFALQHEIGHGIWFTLTMGGRDRELEGLIDNTYSREANNPGLRSYARSSAIEFFAEAFNNYYCSKQSNQYLKDHLPQTYAVFQQHLEAPVWQQASTKIGNAGIALMLGAPTASDEDAALVYAAADKTVARFGFCTGDLAACVKTPKLGVKFQKLARTDAQDSKKVYFRSSAPVQIEPDLPMTLLGIDAAGKIVGARAVKFVDADE